MVVSRPPSDKTPRARAAAAPALLILLLLVLPSLRPWAQDTGGRPADAAARGSGGVARPGVAAQEGGARTRAPSLTGFAAAARAWQEQCEARLQELPTRQAFREHLRTITAEPHPTGSAAQLRVAAYLAATMERAGLQVERAEYDVYLPQLDGLVNEVEIVRPVRLRLQNREPPLPEDPYTGHPDLLPGWNAYAGSGDVTAHVVYANYGRKEDFEELDRLGVPVSGSIVLARYGGNFRGYKVRFAEERGAAGVIMFNDPGTDRLVPYPDGPGMTPWTIQRGSVLTLSWTGDPLTPFEPALPLDGGGSVRRLDPDDVDFPGIPVLPIGYGPAREILSRMTGAAAPDAWRSGIDVTHRITGGDELAVRVHVQQRRDFTRAVNVIGTVAGAELPDEWVILGSHYDPWSFGAHDPNGGTAMLLVLAETLGTLAREGCRPRRSIVIAHWDAEEYGIIGSTEWVEHHRDALTRNAVAYINADGAVTGADFSASASPTLKRPIMEAARAVRYPAGGTVYEHWLRGERAEPGIGNLGGGSDHVGFYTHVGVPAAGLSFGGSNGIYHSNYDTFRFFEQFSDTSFEHGAALARVDGILALRLANADIVPYDVARYGTDLQEHVTSLERLGVDRGVAVQLDALRAAAQSLTETAHAYETARDAWLDDDGQAPPDDRAAPARRAALAGINARLIALEKAFIDTRGLQGRPWSRSLYASPDPFSGYASWMLPGIRYEIETRNAAGVVEWEARYVAAVQELQRRTAELAAATGARR
jgi:N-acetylated-alpha-linked acidic dipeptidase